MTKPLQVFRVQLSKWRLVRELGITLLDVTAKSGVEAFAPRFDDVMAYKRGELSEEAYVKRYLDRMKLSRIKFPDEWLKLTKLEGKVAIGCYCKPFGFCHRHLFAALLFRYLRDHDLEAEDAGELTSMIPQGKANPNVESTGADGTTLPS